MNQIPILLNDVFLFENAELPIRNDSFALGYVTLPEGITRSWGSPSPFCRGSIILESLHLLIHIYIYIHI